MKAYFKSLFTFIITLNYFTICNAYTNDDYLSAINQGDYETAIKIMTDIIKNADQKNGDMYYKRACVYEKMGNFIYAVIDCSTALEYSPDNKEYYTLRGKCKQLANDPTYVSDLMKGQSNNESTRITTDNHTKTEVQKSPIDFNIPLTKGKKSNLFVVILSAEEYLESNISNADFANHDGEILKEYCIKTLGVQKDNVHLRKNVTLSQIKSEMRWLKAVSKEFGDQASALVYFSGHGYPDEITHQAYILPSDGQIYDTDCGYSLSTLYSELGNCKFKYSIVLLDACFSGLKRSMEGGMLSSTRGIAIKPAKDALYGNLIVLSATTSDNIAYPDSNNSHGLFTYYLLEKIRESKGNVSIKDLSDYVIKKVRESSTIKFTKPQIPVLEYSSDLQMPLSEIKL